MASTSGSSASGVDRASPSPDGPPPPPASRCPSSPCRRLHPHRPSERGLRADRAYGREELGPLVSSLLLCVSRWGTWCWHAGLCGCLEFLGLVLRLLPTVVHAHRHVVHLTDSSQSGAFPVRSNPAYLMLASSRIKMELPPERSIQMRPVNYVSVRVLTFLSSRSRKCRMVAFSLGRGFHRLRGRSKMCRLPFASPTASSYTPATYMHPSSLSGYFNQEKGV